MLYKNDSFYEKYTGLLTLLGKYRPQEDITDDKIPHGTLNLKFPDSEYFRGELRINFNYNGGIKHYMPVKFFDNKSDLKTLLIGLLDVFYFIDLFIFIDAAECPDLFLDIRCLLRAFGGDVSNAISYSYADNTDRCSYSGSISIKKYREVFPF